VEVDMRRAVELVGKLRHAGKFGTYRC
jgi:hypothetical protein